MIERAKFFVFKGKGGDWYWRLLAHGRVLAGGGQGYSSAGNAWRGVDRTVRALFDAVQQRDDAQRGWSRASK